MKSKNIVDVLSGGIIIGTIVASINSICHIIVSNYIQYELFRLAAITFQKALNAYIVCFIIGIMMLYIFWLLLAKKMNWGNNKDAKFWMAASITVSALLSLNWFIKKFTIHKPVLKIAGQIEKIITNGVVFSYFIRLKSLIMIFTLIVTAVILITLFYWITKKLKLENILLHVKTKSIRKAAFIAVAFTGCLNLLIFIDTRINIPKSPNVILIGIDTLRADHLGCYGYNKNTTPNIDSIARQGAIFKKAFATSSWTLPSFHSILTSLYQISHRVINADCKLDYSFVTLAEILKNRGYKTAGFVSGPFMKNIFGFNQGFDLYHESASSASHIKSHKDITSPKLTEMVLKWLHKNKDNKFFLFIHYWDPHFDYIPPAPYDRYFDPDYKGKIDGTNIEKSDKINPGMNKRDLEHIIALYDGEIRWTDMHLGKLFNTLRELKLMNNTIIVIVGDHGEEFLEHGSKTHRQTLYNEVIHVPLIFKLPDMQEPVNITKPVSTVDILPTLLEILNIESLSSMDGESLVPVIYGKESKSMKVIYSELHDNLISLEKGTWKLIYDYKKKKYELYDITDDPSEKNNLIEYKTDTGIRLKNKLHEWIELKRSHETSIYEAEKDKETIRQLKTLGYIQ